MGKLNPSRISIAAGIGLAVTIGSLEGLLRAPSAIAQPCYMVTASGQRISLGSLCGDILLPTEAQPAPGGKLKPIKPPTQDGIFRAKIKRRLAATPVIDVSFNGKVFEMIVDTGASSTLIPKTIADALKLRVQGSRQVVIADGSVVKFQTATVDAVTAAGMPARRLTVTVADKADVGLLGHDFFHKYDVKIKRNVIEFQPQSD